MITCDDSYTVTNLRLGGGKDLCVSHNQHSRVNMGLHKGLTTLEVCARFVAMGPKALLGGVYCGRETISG